MLRCFNRMNDLIAGARVEGTLNYHGVDLYDPEVEPGRGPPPHRHGVPEAEPVPQVDLRQRRLRPPHRRHAKKSDLDDIVEKSLRRAALWDEVKDRLKASALGLSGGQQQRLCIARAIAVEPEVILMDEPCSALDPIATARIEDLMQELKTEYTIVIVTHNMQQAARVSDRTAFFTTEVNPESDSRTGLLVEFDRTEHDLLQPVATSGPRTTSPAASADRARRRAATVDELRDRVPRGDGGAPLRPRSGSARMVVRDHRARHRGAAATATCTPRRS